MKILVNELEKVQGQRQQLEGPVITKGIKYPHLQFENFTFMGQAQKIAELVDVAGDLSGAIKTGCSRCATPTTYDFSTSFSEQFSDQIEQVDDDEDEAESEIIPYQGVEIDLTPYFRQTILLDMPQIYLCSDTCKGLCPTCGTNWNEQTCSCNNERIDPRLADLALFFKKDKE
ncbi:hypothetical protein BEP19_07085 [Ammoniphilus oxalaticus]|uniref:DUF177 domain-containing protein n=1 Tax=Ammoniphilus oxalaticus TaxID=66863 RepID=A0A419SJE4_9BACL|nr:DUF177 domain-containing protein [Ammoniphilus oxalaticus]RKD24164.1 hypothetical protein BEP19_07085 [Ammoniphilus oxalaticus]